MKQASIYITVEEYKERKLPINAIATIHVHEAPTESVSIMICQKEEPDIETALEKVSQRIDLVMKRMKLKEKTIKILVNGVDITIEGDEDVSEISGISEEDAA